MDKLTIAEYLLLEANKEIKVIENHDKLRMAYIEADEENAKEVRNAYFTAPHGSKLKAREYLKTIRRITLEIEKELL